MALDSGFFENLHSTLGKVSEITGKVSDAIQSKNVAAAENAKAQAMAAKSGVSTASLLANNKTKMILILALIGIGVGGFLFLGKKRRRR